MSIKYGSFRARDNKIHIKQGPYMPINAVFDYLGRKPISEQDRPNTVSALLYGYLPLLTSTVSILTRNQRHAMHDSPTPGLCTSPPLRQILGEQSQPRDRIRRSHTMPYYPIVSKHHDFLAFRLCKLIPQLLIIFATHIRAPQKSKPDSIGSFSFLMLFMFLALCI